MASPHLGREMGLAVPWENDTGAVPWEFCLCRWGLHAWFFSSQCWHWVNCFPDGSLTLLCSSPSPSYICRHNFNLLHLALPDVSTCVPATSTSSPVRSMVTSLLLLQMKITYQLSSASDVSISPVSFQGPWCLCLAGGWAQEWEQRVLLTWGLLREPCHHCPCVSGRQQSGWAGRREMRRWSLCN